MLVKISLTKRLDRYGVSSSGTSKISMKSEQEQCFDDFPDKSELIPVDGENLDVNGCLVGPSGERVCPLGAFGADGQSRVQFRGNQGPGLTGSNGNAGPINAAGLPVDPAAETYKKQIEEYQKWAEQQVKNAEKQLGTAGRR